jgi:hypothetical protein
VGYAALAKVDSQGFNGAVGTACINNGAVTENKLAAGSVTSAKLAPGGVGSSNIAQGAVTSAKIANAAVSSLYTNTLTAAAWVGESAPYSQAVTINGILAEDVPLIDLAPSQVYATAVNEDEQWAQIYRAVASANTITFYAKDKPTIDLVFRARCIRK